MFNRKEMNKREIRIALNEDTLEFLELAGAGHLDSNIGDFINSLLRQERFRQGYPASQKSGISHVSRPLPPIEREMLFRSGLLPLTLKARR